MIISKTPLRMSFVGGGSDLAVFYREFGGAVVSTAIDKFVYVTVNRKFDEKIRISYSKTEEAKSVEKVKHPLVRESMKLLGIQGGVEITSVADIPGKGTGLGSSSSFTVGLLNALHAFENRHASADKLAQESCEIEIGPAANRSASRTNMPRRSAGSASSSSTKTIPFPSSRSSASAKR